MRINLWLVCVRNESFDLNVQDWLSECRADVIRVGRGAHVTAGQILQREAAPTRREKEEFQSHVQKSISRWNLRSCFKVINNTLTNSTGRMWTGRWKRFSCRNQRTGYGQGSTIRTSGKKWPWQPHHHSFFSINSPFLNELKLWIERLVISNIMISRKLNRDDIAVVYIGKHVSDVTVVSFKLAGDANFLNFEL